VRSPRDLDAVLYGMPTTFFGGSTLNCSHCRRIVPYNNPNCPVCRRFAGWPNVRRAEEMRDALTAHAKKARQEATRRNLTHKVERLYEILNASVATINVSILVLLRMTTSDKYRSIYRAIERGDREASAVKYEAHRKAVDAKLHTGYEIDIVCAALSPDGRGLANYGDVILQIDGAAVSERASVLPENAFAFYERFKLGKRNAMEEPGWRAVWVDRAALGIAHLGQDVTANDDEDALVRRILFSGASRDDDRFMEVNIYDGIAIEAVGRVTLASVPRDGDDQDRWRCAAAWLRRNGIDVIALAMP